MPFKNPHPLYATWQGMRRRCLTPSFRQWDDYGGRGISIDPAWDDFHKFAADMGPKPTPEHSLDRLDNDADYSKENCRWATRKEQQRNQRTTRKVTIEGTLYLVCDLAEKYGKKHETIIARAERGFTFDQVVGSERIPNRRVPVEALAAKLAATNARTHCRKGHEFTPENTYSPKPTQRECRICKNERMRLFTARKKSPGLRPRL